MVKNWEYKKNLTASHSDIIWVQFPHQEEKKIALVSVSRKALQLNTVGLWTVLLVKESSQYSCVFSFLQELNKTLIQFLMHSLLLHLL